MLDTPKKIALARLASSLLRQARRPFGLPDRIRSRRRGIQWELDLAEGIDLSIYLLGAFEPRLVREYATLIRPGACVLDVGANVGAHTLQFARLVGDRGKVLAYEPTAYAFAKLRTNIDLNPTLAPRVVAMQAMLVGGAGREPARSLVSSWPLDGRLRDGPRALGGLHDTAGALALTLDESLMRAGVSTVDFVKIDVDGNELDVLRGAGSLLRDCWPTLFLELAPYEYRNSSDFDALVDMLWRMGYDLRIPGTTAALHRDVRELRARIPILGSINVVATRPQ